MKKSVKRILCGILSFTMTSTLILQRTLSNANAAERVTATASASYKDVTGTIDTSALREKYLNTSVQETTQTTAQYETRTVIVTLSEKSLSEAANGETVGEYADTWNGQRAKAKIESEQDSFLRALKKKGISYTKVREYDTVINGVAVELNTKYVSDIKKMDGVESVVITTSYAEPETATTASSNSVVTNETSVYKTGIYDSSEYAAMYGHDMVVAVLDTGLDYTHPAFQGFESETVELAWDEAYVKEILETKDLSAESRSGTLDSNDVYVSAKVPYAYDYADDDADVYPSYSNHGTHVAGIIGGYDTSGYTDKDGNPIKETFKGVVPDCQLAIFKVFTDDLDDPDLGGAVAEDIIAALDDCVKLGVDVINMSLGTSCGFTTTNDGDDEGELLNEVYERIKASGISLICAASNDYSSGYGGVYGTNLAYNPDSSTVGSPSTFAAALSVASINGQKASYMIANEGGAKESYVFFEESRDINGNPFDFVADLQKLYNKTEFEYVVIPGIGQAADYTSTVRGLFKDASGNSLGRIALIKRGDSTFQEKVEIAMEMGAIGVIVYNNVSGIIRMNLGEIDDPVPAVSISMNAGSAMLSGAVNRIGKIKLSEEQVAGPFMSEFSSWGPTHDLKLKPEITAHGGEITSTVPGGYGEQSGTSMASPNMAGFIALVRSYVKETFGVSEPTEINRLAMQLVMSTAVTVYDQDGLPNSPRKQGAGVARMENVIDGTSAYLSTDNEESDYRPKLELGDDPEKTGVYEMSFKLTNFGTQKLMFATDQLVMTETLASDKLTVSEQAHMLDDANTVWKVNGKTVSQIEVEAGKAIEISVSITLTDKDKTYINQSFENGMYVEGFLQLQAQDQGQCDLSIPFLAFYGDWYSSPMLDYTSFEVAADEQDASIKEEDKKQASVFATQPYSSYYNEKYIIPMGGYVYLLPDDVDPVYVNEDKCAVSRYNNYYGEGEAENYMSTTGIKAVYAGLLRNARVVKYRMYNVQTGELILEDECNRIGKAYAGGGSAVPANVELELSPEEYGLVANGTYRLEFDFFTDGDGEFIASTDGNYWVFPDDAKEENTYEFSFTVDYDAPILEDVRVRYYNYKENGVTKQRIYLDVDIYDNHYAQALMLCYPTKDSAGETTLQLATEYPMPLRDSKKNGTTTVSVEITDIFEKYGSQLYIQVDDYALNTCLYQVNIYTAGNALVSDVKDFDIVQDKKLQSDENGKYTLTLDRYEAYNVSLNFNGEGDRSNFVWGTENPSVVGVKNGEIVGLSEGTAVVSVSTGTGAPKLIYVTVTKDTYTALASVPTISFGVIETSNKALLPAKGFVDVSAGKTFQIPLQTDPWYHPMTNLRVVWSSTDESVATVDENGYVSTLKKGRTVILAAVERQNAKGEWEKTLYSASVTLNVENEFTVSNYTLTKYNGVGGVVTIPSDLNIWYIGEEAFKENNNITKIIIPSSVMEIRERAFMNCTALEEVYFVNEKHRVDENGNIIYYNENWEVCGESASSQVIDWADLSMIYENAFYGCANLKKVDFSNTKTVTVASYAFADCTKLSEIVDMPSIGTMYHYAFANTALASVDLTGLHMSGRFVFWNCMQLSEIKTGRFTAIGDYMFYGCTNLRGMITLSTPKIGNGAFSDCQNLSGVTFDALGEDIKFEIGEKAFENCGKNVGVFTVDFNDQTIRSIGKRAFAGSAIQLVGGFNGLEVLGENIFANTTIKTIVLNNTFDLENIRLQGIPFTGATIALTAQNSDNYVLEDDILYNKAKTKIIYVNPSRTEVTVGNSVESIGDYAFAGSNVIAVTLAPSVTSIGVGAFESSALRTIDFNGANIAKIAEKTFKNTKELSFISLPDSITELGVSAFEGSALSNFKADKLEKVGDNAFANCQALRGEQADGKFALKLTATKLGNGVFFDCISLENVAFDSVTEMGARVFNGAKALKSVSFGEETTTVGSYTFMNTSVENVELGACLMAIGEGVFYGCTKLAEIDLPDTVQTIAVNAFRGCKNLTAVQGIENVVTIESQAFYNTPLALRSLHLESAETIGYSAFAIEKNAANVEPILQAELKIPVVKKIDRFAFMNAHFAKVELPVSLTEIGYGAFALKMLGRFEVAEGNTIFFEEEGVLYRYIDKEQGLYELVCYPATSTVGNIEENEKTVYTVKEGTVRIEAYAFYNLGLGILDKVILPYTLNTIGDSAFFGSGIEEYTFESIQAPTLETVYRSEIADAIEAVSTISYYKGYYYANFETYIYDYSSYGSDESALVMYYPANGVGYTDYIYSLYFGKQYTMDIFPEDDTRICMDMITALPAASEIDSWLNWALTEDNKQIVQEMSNTVKSARLYYNNTQTDASQASFITEELENKLFEVEKSLRKVKSHFGVAILLESLRVAGSSTHRSEYVAGESFDMSGLVVEMIYDDYSTEIADASKVTLETTGGLSKLDRYVIVQYEGKELRVAVTVSENTAGTDSSSSNSTGTVDAGCKNVGWIIGIAVGVVLVAAVGLYFWKFRLNKSQNQAKAGETTEEAGTEETAESAKRSEETEQE